MPANTGFDNLLLCFQCPRAILHERRFSHACSKCTTSLGGL